MAPPLTPPHNKFPSCATCPLLSTGDAETCVRCVASSAPLRDERCATCSRRLRDDEDCGNPVCNWDDRHIGTVHAICRRTGSIETLLKKFKYEDGYSGWAPILGRIIVGWLWTHPRIAECYELIVVNPTHLDRQPIRHTERILAAAHNEDQLGLWPLEPADDTTLVKREPTTSATAVGASWRHKKDAADELWWAVDVAHPERVKGKDVLIVDDVTTTLLQLNVLAGLLERAGAKSVDGLVIARQGG